MTKQEFENIKLGDKVRYIYQDTPEEIAAGYFPPVDTIGSVIAISYGGYMMEVQWDIDGYDIEWFSIYELEIYRTL